MIRLGYEASCCAMLLPGMTALAAPLAKVASSPVRPIAVPVETWKEMAKYSLKAYENGNPTNRVRALLFTPKPVGMNALPMVVYIPGSGELGDIALQFRLSNIEGEDKCFEDLIEDDTSKPGKALYLNELDQDKDGIPDWADGYDSNPVFGNQSAADASGTFAQS